MGKFNLNDLPPGMRDQAQRKLEEMDGSGTTTAAAELLGRTSRKISKYPEGELQMECIRMAKVWPMGALLSELWPREIRRRYLKDYLYHIPNQRGEDVQRRILGAMGVKPGVFDLFLMLPTNEAPGLYLEAKAGDNGLTDHQENFKFLAEMLGYECGEFRSTSEFATLIEQYLLSSAPNPYYLKR